MRKGLTGDEILSMSMKEFYMVYLFDTFIEPQGPVMNDFYQARLAHSVKWSTKTGHRVRVFPVSVF